MRKHITFYFVLFSFLISTIRAKAQQEFGQIVVNIGVGESPEFSGNLNELFSSDKMFPILAYNNDPYFSYDYPRTYNTSSIIPNLGATGDFGLLNWFSIGIAASYQSEVVNWTPADDGYNGGNFIYPYTDKVSRINVASRILFHISKSKICDFYTGFRIGVSFWHDILYSSSYVNPNSNLYINQPAYFICKSNIIVPSFQYLWGVRILPINNFGFHLEVGIGSPYLAEGGLTFRINTKKPQPTGDTGVMLITN